MEELQGITPAEFLESHIFPTLLPGLEATLRTAKHTERRKRFNPLDYLSAYLFRNNPNGGDRADVPFKDIPFVRKKWAVEPRPSLPLSATLTEEEAATIIQAHYRGYRIRCTNPHVVEFRKWQRRLAEEKKAVYKIQKWWRNVMSSGKLSRVVEKGSAVHDADINKSEKSEKTEEESVRDHINNSS